MKESSQARTAFADYLAQSPPRSLERLVENYRPQSASEAPPPTRRIETLKEWSVAHGWQDRIAAIEREAAAAARAAEVATRTAEIAKRRERRLKIADVEHIIVVTRLSRLVKDDEAIAGLSVYEVVAMAKHAGEAERLEDGQATTRAEISPTGGTSILDKVRPGLAALSYEELDQLERHIEKMSANSVGDGVAIEGAAPAAVYERVRLLSQG